MQDLDMASCLQSHFIRLRQNTLRLAAGMNGKVNRAVARRAKAGWLWRNSACYPTACDGELHCGSADQSVSRWILLYSKIF
jgi:hypothetical protein